MPKDTKKIYEKGKNWGILTSIDLHSCDAAYIRDAKKIEEFVIKLCKLIKVKRFGKPVIVHFGKRKKIAGYSLVQLIETSLVSGHFANETNNVYLDIFSCCYYNPEKAVNFCKKFFKAQKASHKYIFRK